LPLGAVLRIVCAATRRGKDGLTSGVVLLTSGATETENWMKRAEQAISRRINCRKTTHA